MAKIIRDESGNVLGYKPGVIYDLGFYDPVDIVRIPFYVGETHDPDRRLQEHQREGKVADEASTRVYQTIRDIEAAGMGWDMKIIAQYGTEGPSDLEDEWIMKYLLADWTLTNMKKGNANWMTERQTEARDMRRRNITSYREYRRVITQEELDRRHARWLKQEAEKTKSAMSQRIQQQALAFREANAPNQARKRRKEQRERERILEHEAWLKSLKNNGLFE
mgnify:CR=1 FL=1